jgi:hypothetical protein
MKARGWPSFTSPSSSEVLTGMAMDLGSMEEQPNQGVA